MRFVAGMMAAVLTVAAPFEQTPDIVFGAQREADQKLPADGLTEPVTEQIVRVLSDGTGAADGTNTLRSIRPEIAQYDWDCYSSDYYYSKLSTKEQQLYERLDAACGELLTSPTLNAASYEVNSGGEKITRRGTKKVSTLGLSSAQVQKVQALFLYANPQYYFLNILLFVTGDNKCALGIYDAFADGSERAKETKKVLAKLEELQAQISDNGIPYETEAQIHELLCEKLTYKTGDEALNDRTDAYYLRTIYGALMSGETVCAGYTKLYEALCNYFGIDCISVTSSDHAWNEVRYGDHWYIVDVTWNDSWDRGKYFHLTDQQMKQTDQNDSHVPYSYYDGIRPEADTAFAGELMLMKGLGQPQVEIKDTAPGVTITMTSGEGEIYYTLDGTMPGKGDLYTGPVELTDSGTYIVTAMTVSEGMLPSAYEIFPVRIAGGSVSVASAVNVSGRKIRVKCKTSNSYVGYEVSWASKKDFSNQKSCRFNCSDLKGRSVVISGLKKGKTYYIRVRGYKKDIYGNYYYTPYSKMKKVTVTK